MSKERMALVTGAGGFIGSYLVDRLVEEGFFVRGVDIKFPAFENSKAHEFFTMDLRRRQACQDAVEEMDDVYHLAADMGGIGYIGTQTYQIAQNNSLIDMNMLQAATSEACTERFFYSSSACVYPMQIQDDEEVDVNLAEDMAWPANPEPGYGMEKLFMEKMCEYARKENKLRTYVARFHNIYGPKGTFDGGREKAPAALCRKVAKAKKEDTIEIWGDGSQRRSYTYIDDCVEGIRRMVESKIYGPLNIGSCQAITTRGLVELIAQVAFKKITIRCDPTKPTGVMSRNSDNIWIRQLLGWEPQTLLIAGISRTYDWINSMVGEKRMGAS